VGACHVSFHQQSHFDRDPGRVSALVVLTGYRLGFVFGGENGVGDGQTVV
jgi:hypothetical protein